MSPQVSDKTKKFALVTGGALRVGRALCFEIAKQGYNVGVHYSKSASQANDLCAELQALGVDAKPFGADLSSDQGVTELTSGFENEFHCRADLLVNNASVFGPQSLTGYNSADGWLNWQIHVNAPLLLSQWVTAENGSGRDHQKLIVNMLDQRVLNPSPGFVSYNASKSALAAMTKSLAIELAPYVRVNGIAPGPALPPPKSKGEGFDDYAATMPLGYGSSPAELAEVLAFLMHSKSITGQIIASDGGQHLGYLNPAEAERNNRLKRNSGIS